jgi:hypothetical protein
MPAYTGRHLDGFRNRITVYAVSNPYISNHEPAALHDCAPGYGIIRFNKKKQTITMECWPRYADPDNTEQKQYPGWPLTISMLDNYGMGDEWYLPLLTVRGLSSPPVIQVTDEDSGEIVYTVRWGGWKVRPPVPVKGTYSVVIGEPGTEKIRNLEHLKTAGMDDPKEIEVVFK